MENRRKSCALVLRGGVSPIDRQYRSIRKQPSGIEKVDISVVRESLFRNLQETNPSWDFDFYLFSWDSDLESKYGELFDFQAQQFEGNGRYRAQIWTLVLRNLVNALLFNFPLFKKKMANLKATLAQDFSGISQSLSISKAMELLKSNDLVKQIQYDLVILCRPDVIVLEPIDLENYSPEVITCNGYKDRQGDFRWIFGTQFLEHFISLPTHFKGRGIHQPHVWIRDYFDSKGLPYKMDKVQAGLGEEVLRKTRGNGIAFSDLEKYGLSKSEYSRYPN